MVVASALDKFDGSIPFRAFLIVCMRRYARDEIRRQRLNGFTRFGCVRVSHVPRRVHMLDEMARRGDSVAETDRRLDCEALLIRLPREDRVTLTTWWAGLSAGELGRALGVSRTHAQNLYHRSLRHARAVFGRYETPMDRPITIEKARRFMSALTEGGALTEVELWQLIDYLISMSPRRPPTVQLPPIDPNSDTV